jgi:hypothetical protein
MKNVKKRFVKTKALIAVSITFFFLAFLVHPGLVLASILAFLAASTFYVREKKKGLRISL